MAFTPTFKSLQRRRLWECEAAKAKAAGLGDLPICNICELPVETNDWHRSHHPLHPRAFSGRDVGVAHADCNLIHGRKVVVPAVARSNRARNRFVEQRRTFAGSGRYPMRGGIESRDTKTFKRGVQTRQSLAEKHAATMRRRAIVPPGEARP